MDGSDKYIYLADAFDKLGITIPWSCLEIIISYKLGIFRSDWDRNIYNQFALMTCQTPTIHKYCWSNDKENISAVTQIKLETFQPVSPSMISRYSIPSSVFSEDMLIKNLKIPIKFQKLIKRIVINVGGTWFGELYGDMFDLNRYILRIDDKEIIPFYILLSGLPLLPWYQPYFEIEFVNDLALFDYLKVDDSDMKNLRLDTYTTNIPYKSGEIREIPVFEQRSYLEHALKKNKDIQQFHLPIMHPVTHILISNPCNRKNNMYYPISIKSLFICFNNYRIELNIDNINRDDNNYIISFLPSLPSGQIVNPLLPNDYIYIKNNCVNFSKIEQVFLEVRYNLVPEDLLYVKISAININILRSEPFGFGYVWSS
jgi:hypothetical protein